MILSRLVDFAVGDLTIEDRRRFSSMFFRSLLVFHIAWACGLLVAVGLPQSGFLQAQDLLSVHEEVQANQSSLKKLDDNLKTWRKVLFVQQLETEIKRLDQEIFNIDMRVSERTRAGAIPDRIYMERLSDLRSEKARVENRLRSFMNSNPTITAIDGRDLQE